MEKKMTKKEVYASFGIEYDTKTQKIKSPIGMVKPPLVDGNKKIGKGAFHFSTLPGTALYDVVVNNMSFTVKGTCPCDCVGCYAKTGNYRFQSVKNALGMRTILAREHMAFLERAINAQIAADNIKLLRIHAAGDMFSLEYAAMWQRIARNNPGVIVWTYTKLTACESMFDGLNNANIVKSIIPGIGKNYGTCAYIIGLYHTLKAAGHDVYICRCGVDNNQHCTTCTGCSKNKYVLFLEHSTDYKAAQDPLFPEFIKLVNSQPVQFITAA